MAVSSRIRLLFLLPLLTAGAVHGAPNSFMHQAQHPFDNNGDSLPDLGLAAPTGEGEKHLAEMAKAFGEASMTDNGMTTGEQARQFAFGQVRDAVSGEVNQQIESWLSPWGNASVNASSVHRERVRSTWLTVFTTSAHAPTNLSSHSTVGRYHAMWLHRSSSDTRREPSQVPIPINGEPSRWLTAERCSLTRWAT